MDLKSLVQLLVNFTERAAVIARTIREDDGLFQLLVEEKTGDQKNDRFNQDFKTLADVLIQQLLCFQVEKEFPALSGRVHGEECAVFSNAVGETVTVKIQDTEQATAHMLTQVLDGNVAAATTLAKQVHRTDTNCSATVEFDELESPVPLEQLAIWIDPIDSTYEYIRGDSENCSSSQSFVNDSAATKGLKCVTVLTGVFRTDTGLPIAGIINQPFAEHRKKTDGSLEYSGRVYWAALSCNNLSAVVPSIPAALKRVTVSGSEDSSIVAALTRAGVEVVPAPGAGYKCLLAVTGRVQAYICTKGSTYMWDTCAPHACLLSQGGGEVSYSCLAQFATGSPPDHALHQLLYRQPEETAGSSIAPYCNSLGLVAYASVEHLLAIARILHPTE